MDDFKAANCKAMVKLYLKQFEENNKNQKSNQRFDQHEFISSYFEKGLNIISRIIFITIALQFENYNLQLNV